MDRETLDKLLDFVDEEATVSKETQALVRTLVNGMDALTQRVEAAERELAAMTKGSAPTPPKPHLRLMGKTG